MEGQFEFLIENNEYVTNDAPNFVKNGRKQSKTKKENLRRNRILHMRTSYQDKKV